MPEKFTETKEQQWSFAVRVSAAKYRHKLAEKILISSVRGTGLTGLPDFGKLCSSSIRLADMHIAKFNMGDGWTIKNRLGDESND